VVPNEPRRKRGQEDIEEARQGRRDQSRGSSKGRRRKRRDSRRKNRKIPGPIYFEYDMATGKVTRLDNFEAPKKKTDVGGVVTGREDGSIRARI